MLTRIKEWLDKNYPQNYIVRKPYAGTLIFLGFCFGFAIIYKPLGIHGSRSFGFMLTMAIYLSTLSIPVFFIIQILKKIRYFSNPNEWTIIKEIIAIALALLIMGIALYFVGFLMESPGNRWNFETFLDSCKHAFLLGIIPFGFFTIINYRYLFVKDIAREFNQDLNQLPAEPPEELIRIGSQLKKEELSFYPSQFLYAASEGNYVVFHWMENNHVQKKLIRNSISNIEQQLSAIPFFIRTHRAFIVNVKQIISQKGNTLGYRIKLEGIDDIIPVSRQNAREFDQLLKRYR
ncbi:MAG: LytTR family DNA-binding domain-containing protein [Bacteroidales bacterium]